MVYPARRTNYVNNHSSSTIPIIGPLSRMDHLLSNFFKPVRRFYILKFCYYGSVFGRYDYYIKFCNIYLLIDKILATLNY